jgi:hypothetical protein
MLYAQGSVHEDLNHNIKKWSGSNVAPISHQILTVPTEEKFPSSLRNRSLSLGFSFEYEVRFTKG